MEKKDIDVKPVVLDKLVKEFTPKAIVQRIDRIENLLKEFNNNKEDLTERLDHVNKVLSFLTKEYDNVLLAQKLQDGVLVRVVCPACDGSGLKPTDVTDGRVTYTAFETLKSSTVDIRPEAKCSKCSGNRWIIMTRFCG